MGSRVSAIRKGSEPGGNRCSMRSGVVYWHRTGLLQVPWQGRWPYSIRPSALRAYVPIQRVIGKIRAVAVNTAPRFDSLGYGRQAHLMPRMQRDSVARMLITWDEYTCWHSAPHCFAVVSAFKSDRRDSVASRFRHIPSWTSRSQESTSISSKPALKKV